MSPPGSWGPFLPDLHHAERLARLRSLSLAVRVFCGPRGKDVALALLQAEIAGEDAETLAQAEQAFGRLAPLDRRKVL